MKIAVRAGHNYLATGASGIINEVEEDRLVTAATITYLKELGHTVLDVTPSRMSKKDDLHYGVSRANSWGADIFISIHFNNAYNSYQGAIGTECCIFSNGGNAEVVGARICKGIGSLGFKNRGNKLRPELYETKYTHMASVIVEVCFVEATDDVAIYKKVGADKVGKTIAEAITNKKVVAPALPDGQLYHRVVTGSFANKNNALERKKELKEAGFDSFIEPYYK